MLLEERVAQASVRRVARELGLSSSYLHGVLTGQRRPGPKVLRALGLMREVVYHPLSAQ
jgi:hypothetical protein